MTVTADMIPERFWGIAYDQNHDPDSPVLPQLSESPNCQNFAYALLQSFGHGIRRFAPATCGTTRRRRCA